MSLILVAAPIATEEVKGVNEFEKAMLHIPENSRCVQTSPGAWKLPRGHLYFGLKENKQFGWTTAGNLPNEVKGVSFFMGGERNKPLVSSFIDSGYAGKVERLSIGMSCSTQGGGTLDHKSSLSSLKGVSFPNLRVLELGIWQLFSNSYTMHGNLGDVTSILAGCPKLEKFGLYGEFVLSKPMSFKHLKVLDVEPADNSTGEQSIDPATFNCVFNSDCPALGQLRFISAFEERMTEWADRSIGNYKVKAGANVYRFPDRFLSKGSMPLLSSVLINGEFEKGEKTRFLNSSIGKRNTLDSRLLEGFFEVYK